MIQYMFLQIETARKDGSIVFKNGKVVQADTIVHCTGYIYHFPFLNTNGYITVEDNCVGPLYKHVFPPALAPGLSFIGLPWMVKSLAHPFYFFVGLIIHRLIRLFFLESDIAIHSV